MIKPLRLFVNLLSSFLFVLKIVCLVFFTSCAVFTSSKKRADVFLKRADQATKAGNYTEAEDWVKQSIEADSCNIKAYLALSDISDELSKPVQQKEALRKILELDSFRYPLAYKLFANRCFDDGEYIDALTNYQIYNRYKKASDSAFVSMRINSALFAISSIKENRTVDIQDPGTNINTNAPEYWPAIATNDSMLYFTRLIRHDARFPYERIFISQLTADGWQPAEQLSLSSDETINIGTMCISADGKLLFYTACGEKNGRGSCDIYYARKENNIWGKSLSAGPVLNTSAWEAQPSVSADNRYIYFASNRKGGEGGMDIWRCEMQQMKNGLLFFSNPVNLGKGINTKENDFSPFIHADGTTLYFASEGKCGFGGSDIYISKFRDSVWSEAENLGYPINSRFNDDGLVVSPTAKVAFFSSNREGTKDRSKDLFQINLPDQFLPEKVGYIAGKVYDRESRQCVDAEIEITLLETGNKKMVISDVQEGYITTLNAGKLYALHVEKEGYLFYARHFDLQQMTGFKQAEKLDIYLDPVKVGKCFVLPNVFFDFNSSDLKPESYDELQKLTDFLRENNRLVIEIDGHTDNVGDAEYNQALSENRAKAIYNYLIKFIDSSRLSYKGYGNTLPVVSNDTEEGRAQNRRCEIKIVSN